MGQNIFRLFKTFRLRSFEGILINHFVKLKVNRIKVPMCEKLREIN